jgi:2',3'-cyclic-nucleotide 2'-phosphodiesterase (5'-nucleotidase family)
LKNRKSARSVLVLVLVISLVFSSFGFVFAEGHGEDVFELTIFHTNDVHGRLTGGVGMPRIATIVNQYRAENDHVLLLDAGDILHGQPIVNFAQGEVMIDVMNEVGYDYMVAGNHDFNYGFERLIELDGLANFPIFAGNVVYEGTQESIIDLEYDIIDYGEYKIGIFGIATPETRYKTHPDGVTGLEFLNPVEYAQERMDYFDANHQLDFVIALAHLGIDDSTIYEERSTAIAELVEGIDLIVDGHSHSTLDGGMTVGDTLIVQTGQYGGNLGQVVVTIENEEITYEVQLIDEDSAASYEENAEILSMIAAAEEELKEIYSRVIGTNENYLDGERENVRTGETNLGNLITDAMLETSGADVALTNGGGIRESIQEGDITVGDVAAVLPFGNILVTIEVSGETLMEALEHGTSDYPDAKGAFPHVAGMSYMIDPDGAEGERVHSVMINDEPIDLQVNYIVATNDFLAAGGDDYEMLREVGVHEEFHDLAEVMVEFIEAMEVVNYEVEGRIQVGAYEEPIDDDNGDDEDDTDDEDDVDDEDGAVDEDDPADDDEKEPIPKTGDQNYYLYLFAVSSLMALGAVKIKKSEA